MINLEIDYNKVGLNHQEGVSILNAINNRIKTHPNKEIVISDIAEAASETADKVKKILFLLITSRKIEATFLPRHKVCGYVVGRESRSELEILRKIENEDLSWCHKCNAPIEDINDIDIQIVFRYNEV